MKQTSILHVLLFSMITLFVACSDDNYSNPQLITPMDFTLNTPAYANLSVDFSQTDSMSLTWSQPQYTADNAPLSLHYEILVSLTDQFTTSIEDQDNDLTGTLIADYAAIPRTTTYCRYTMMTADLNNLIMQLGHWSSVNQMPKQMPVYIRVNAFVQENLKRHHEKQSNSITLTALPYYQEIKYVDPILWYMVGDCIGSKAWGNEGPQAIGTGIIPLFYVPGERYNKTTGTGTIAFTAYFPAGKKFRVVATPGVWENEHGFEQLVAPAENPLKYQNIVEVGDDNNIVIKQGGYYTISANTATNVMSFDAYEGEVKQYTTMTVEGTFANLTDYNLTPVFTVEGQENHLWSCTLQGGDRLRVKANDGTVWGHKLGLQGKDDGNGYLMVPEGKHLFLFNDITGDYMLIAK